MSVAPDPTPTLPEQQQDQVVAPGNGAAGDNAAADGAQVSLSRLTPLTRHRDEPQGGQDETLA